MGKHEDKRANIFLATVAMLSAFFVYSSMVLTGKRFHINSETSFGREDLFSNEGDTINETTMNSTHTEETAHTSSKYVVSNTTTDDNGILGSGREYIYDNATATSFKRYDGVVIVTKVLWQKDLQQLMEWACLISHAYNDRMKYDVLIFTTIEWDDDSIAQLQRAVAPAKLTVAIEAPPLEEHLSSMTKEEVQFLRDRCQLKDKPNETLTWWHYCSDPGETRVTSNLAYAWQAEFRAYHIWTHPALKNYKYMMWLDSDVNIAKHWDMDPMKTMIENDLTVLYAGWPYGKLRDKAVKKKMTGAYNTSICSIQKTSGSEHIYPKLCKDQKGYFEIRQIAGNHHITNLDVFRKEVHQKFLKNFTGDFRFNRKFDDQLAVTLVGMFEHYLVNGFDNPSVKYTMWNERANGLTLKIGHHRIYDVQENDKNERAIVSRPKFFNHIKANYTGLEERCGNIFFPGRKEKELI